MPESSADQTTDKASNVGRQILRLLLIGGQFALAVGLVFVGATVLHTRAAAVGPLQPSKAVFVPTRVVQVLDGYSMQRRFAGRIEAARQLLLASELGGTVTRIAVQEGQRVAKGDVIAQLDLRSIKADRAQQRARRRALEKDRELAQLNANRQLKLKEQGYTSGQAWDAARLRVESLDSSIAQIDGALRAIRINISKAEVVAPFDGIVGARLVDEGSALAPGAALVSLFEKSQRQARIGLPPQVAAQLAESMRYQLEVNGTTTSASLDQLRPDINSATRTVTAVFTLDDVSVPRFGEMVQLVLAQHQTANGFWLPLTALKEGERGLWDVLLVQQSSGGGHVVAREAVEVLHADGERAYVRGALADGDRIVGNGTHRVTVGQSVRISRDASE